MAMISVKHTRGCVGRGGEHEEQQDEQWDGQAQQDTAAEQFAAAVELWIEFGLGLAQIALAVQLCVESFNVRHECGQFTRLNEWHALDTRHVLRSEIRGQLAIIFLRILGVRFHISNSCTWSSTHLQDPLYAHSVQNGIISEPIDFTIEGAKFMFRDTIAINILSTEHISTVDNLIGSDLPDSNSDHIELNNSSTLN